MLLIFISFQYYFVVSMDGQQSKSVYPVLEVGVFRLFLASPSGKYTVRGEVVKELIDLQL